MAVVALVVSAVVSVTAPDAIDAADHGYFVHGATLVHYSLTSELLGRRLDEVAVVPSGPARRPLLVLLHGRHDPRPGSSPSPRRSGPESMLGDALFAGLAALGKEAPIVVLLNGGQHSWYHDRRSGRWSSMLLDEAIPDAIRRFHADADRIAIGGISMGGFGALDLGRIAAERFCAVGGHSPAVYERGTTDSGFGFDDQADFDRHDLLRIASERSPYDVPVWIDVGDRDFLRPVVEKLAKELEARDADITFHVWPGNHDGRYWDQHFTEYLRFYADACS